MTIPPSLFSSHHYRPGMPLDDIIGRTYGPTPYRLDPEKVADFVAATGDDPLRWATAAPPSLAGALLFSVTPALLKDPDLASYGGGVIHGDQSFSWHRPLTYGLELEVLGEVTKLRERGGVAFLGFGLTVSDADGVVIEGSSTFLLSGESSAAGGYPEESEPDPDDSPASGDMTRGASRSDLVRYAGASRDFNPIHWDHAAAVNAGLAGVVVHGLLQSAWMLQSVDSVGDFPLSSARFRYRNPLRPGIGVTIDTTERDDGTIDVMLRNGDTEFVSARVERTS